MKNQLIYVNGPMETGKSAEALKERFNRIQKGFGVTTIKPTTDTRDGATMIRSRIGLEAPAIAVTTETDLIALVQREGNPVVIVDEAQFFTVEQVNAFRELADMGYEVICYGLKTDFRAQLFEGSKRLLELADVVKELEGVCRCGRKAIINARLDAMGNVVTEGDVIDCGMHYESMCYHCWNAHTKGREV